MRIPDTLTPPPRRNFPSPDRRSPAYDFVAPLIDSRRDRGVGSPRGACGPDRLAGSSGAQALEYLMEENRGLRRQLGKQRLQFSDTDRRRLAVRGHWLGRQVLRQIGPSLHQTPFYGGTQRALKNVGHRVGRSTIARILKTHGVSPVPARPTSWQTFLRAHWGTIAAADFFTTEVWTWRGWSRSTLCS